MGKGTKLVAAFDVTSTDHKSIEIYAVKMISYNI